MAIRITSFRDGHCLKLSDLQIRISIGAMLLSLSIQHVGMVVCVNFCYKLFWIPNDPLQRPLFRFTCLSSMCLISYQPHHQPTRSATCHFIRSTSTETSSSPYDLRFDDGFPKFFIGSIKFVKTKSNQVSDSERLVISPLSS